MYVVSDNVQNKLEALLADSSVQKAVETVFADKAAIIEKQKELVLIPAPTGSEQKKAERLLEMFKEEGLTDCHIDEYGNCVGIRKGTGGGKTTLLEAHMDTVFPMDTKLEIIEEDGYIKCPGIADNTWGCVALLSVVRALNAASIQTKGDIHVVGTVKEEGIGAFRGMKYYCNHHPELEASITVDGVAINMVTYLQTGLQTYEIIFHGGSGHVYANFGNVSNALHAAGRAIAKIAEIEVSSNPFTTYGVTGCHVGTIEGIHAVMPEVHMTFNYRSDSQEEMDKVGEKIFAAIDEACAEETARWGTAPITYTVIHHNDCKVGKQDVHDPIVEAAFATAKCLGTEPGFNSGGCTNLGGALEAGIPGICVGLGGTYNVKCHSLEEQFKPDDAHECVQQALLITLLCAGTDIAESIL